MGLDFYNLSDLQRRNKLFEITEQEFEEIGSLIANHNIGVEIDPYGTTRLHPSHVTKILDILNSKLKNGKSNKLIMRIHDQLSAFSDGFLVIGD